MSLSLLGLTQTWGETDSAGCSVLLLLEMCDTGILRFESQVSRLARAKIASKATMEDEIGVTLTTCRPLEYLFIFR